MPEIIPSPDPDASLDDRGSVLHVPGGPDHPTLEYRVDDGLVFVRVLTHARQLTPARPLTPAGGTSVSPSRQWQEAPASTVLELFSANSPVASWLRTRGVDLLRTALLDIGGPDATRQEES